MNMMKEKKKVQFGPFETKSKLNKKIGKEDLLTDSTETLKVSESIEELTESTENLTEISSKDEISKKEEITPELRIEKKKGLYKSLWEREYEYADVLVRMLKNFRNPLIEETKRENPFISKSQIDTLFDGFDEILDLSWSLCGELKVIYNMYKQLKPVNLGNVFLKHAKEFDIYFKYCSRFSTANELLRELNNNVKFRRYQNAMLKSSSLLSNGDYRELLRLPINHIAEYDKILRELLDNTAKYDPSYEMLEDSYEYFDDLYLEMKEALKKEKKVDEILEIRKSIVDCPRNIVKPGRLLYRDFSNLVELPSNRPYRVVIFSDILILAKWDKKIKRFVFNRAISYKALKVLDDVSKDDLNIFSLLLLNPFSKRNFELTPQSPPVKGKRPFSMDNKPPMNRSDSFTRAFSRLFSWSFNQNITRIDLKAPSPEIRTQIVSIINKRISELHPPPFELLWPDPTDIYDTDVVKGIHNPVPADPNEILLDSYICNAIYHSFPKRLRIKRSLTQLYSLQNHGSSLSTFYERSNAGYGTAQVLVIKDSGGNIFGCFTSEPFKINNGFYGTGESFLFKVQKPKTHSLSRRTNFSMGRRHSSNNSNMSNYDEPTHGEVKVFPWAKTNYLFINSTNEYVAVGSGNGKYGIWCDNQFQRGQSYPTETFHNECLATAEQYDIVNVELWAFTSQIEREFAKKRQSRFPTKFQKLN